MAPKAQGPPPYSQQRGLSGVATISFADHTLNEAKSAYWGKAPSQGRPFLQPLWSIQFYVTYGATAGSAPDLPVRLLVAVRESLLEIYPLRFDVNFLPGADVERCMEHYRREKTARRQDGATLEIIRQYDESYQSFLVMVDSANWDSEGVITCRFDAIPDSLEFLEDGPGVPDMLIRQGVKVARPQGVKPMNGNWGGDGPEAEGRLSDTIHDFKFTEGDFNDSQQRYHEALEDGRSDWK